MPKKICSICQEEIKRKDNYCRLTDYKLGEFFVEGFYHALCYSKQIKGQNPQQKMAMKMLDKANKLLNRIGLDEPEPEKVYKIT